jgi:hypothetical protein
MVRIFDLYKPLRNHLRPLYIEDALYVIWAYFQHMQFNNAIPADIQVDGSFINAKSVPERGVFEWELSVIAREVIIHAQDLPNPNNITLRKWDYLAGAVNKLKHLENNAWPLFGNMENVQLELNRIAHRQFRWQEDRPDQTQYTRYYKIFSSPELEKIVKEKIGLTVKEWYMIGLALVGSYLHHYKLNIDPKIQIATLDIEKFNRFISHVALDYSSLKERLTTSQQLNEKFVYTFNAMASHPIIKWKEFLLCPIPTFLYWRITDGLYYEVCDSPVFGNAFGSAFQSYVGEAIQASNSMDRFQIFPEEEYTVGKFRKDSVDWIIDEKNAALFVECKTKRMRIDAKAELISDDVLQQELEKMAEFIIQVYKSIKDYKEDRYPSYKHQKNRKVFPLILTLENWYLFGDKLMTDLNAKVVEKFIEQKLPLEWLEEMPYSMSAIDEFERVLQVIQEVGIEKFFSQKGTPEKRLWSLGPYMTTEFPENYRRVKALFPKDFEKIYSDLKP